MCTEQLPSGGPDSPLLNTSPVFCGKGVGLIAEVRNTT